MGNCEKLRKMIMITKQNFKKPLKIYRRICRRCSDIYSTQGKYSKICEKCRRKRGKKPKNDKN